MKKDVNFIRKAVGVGLGSMAAIVALCAALMIGSVEFLERRATSQKWSYEREFSISLSIEKNIAKMVDCSALYEYSGLEFDLREAEKAFAAIKRSIEDARSLGTNGASSGSFFGEIEKIEKKVTTYGLVIEDIKKSAYAVRQSQSEAETAGKEFLASLNKLIEFASINQTKPAKLQAAFEAKSLAETLTSSYFAAAASRIPVAISAEMNAFGTIEERLKSFEAAGAGGESQASAAREKAKEFKKALEVYIRSLGELGLVSEVRKRASADLLKDADKVASAAIDKANEAATKSSNTLWLVSIFVLIAAAIAIVGGISISVIVLKKLDYAGEKEFDWLERKASDSAPD